MENQSKCPSCGELLKSQGKVYKVFTPDFYDGENIGYKNEDGSKIETSWEQLLNDYAGKGWRFVACVPYHHDNDWSVVFERDA